MSRQLVERARLGDHVAFETLAAGAVDRLHGLARLILRDPDLADDATQEALFRAWRDLPSLRDPDRWEAWLRRLTVHACMDLARTRRRMRAQVRILDAEPWTGDATSEVVDRELVSQAMRRLTTEQRTVLILRYHLGLDVPDVADALGIPLGTAKSRLHYATNALRAALEADTRPAAMGVTA